MHSFAPSWYSSNSRRMPIPQIQKYRDKQASLLPAPIGVYALCDLDEFPIYVGLSVDGIRARVRRHLTSARSGIIANRQVDVWEIAFVWAWVYENREGMSTLEGFLFHQFDAQSRLMNGTIPVNPGVLPFAPPEKARIAALSHGPLRSAQPLPSEFHWIRPRSTFSRLLIPLSSRQVQMLTTFQP